MTESDWTDEDRDYALALLAEEAETCSSCGQPISECRDPASAGQWSVVTDWCQASRVLIPVMRDADPSHHGVFYGVRRNPS